MMIKQLSGPSTLLPPAIDIVGRTRLTSGGWTLILVKLNHGG